MYYFDQRSIQRPPREKFKRLKAPKYDYTKTGMLVIWLFLKYDLSFTDYENKTKRERKMLREEFFLTRRNIDRMIFGCLRITLKNSERRIILQNLILTFELSRKWKSI